MANTLDLGKILSYDLQLQQLDEQRRRNDLYERHINIQQRQAEEVERAHVERERMRAVSVGMKLVDDPTIPLQTKAMVYRSLANLAGFGDLDLSDMLGAEESLKSIGRAYIKKDQAGLEQGIIDLSLRFPDLAMKNLELLQKTQGLTEKAEAHKMTLELNAERLRALQQQDAAVTAARYTYQPVLDQFDAHLRVFEKGRSLYDKSESARQALIRTNPDLRRFFDELRDRIDVSAMMETEARKEEEYWAAQLRAVDQGQSQADPSLIELRRVSAHRVAEARKREQQWLRGLQRSQWSKADLEAFEQARQELADAMVDVTKQSKQIANERLALQTRKFDEQSRYNQQVALAQAHALKHYGFAISAEDLSGVAQQYGVKPSDILPALSDPSKKGRVSVELSPTVKTNLQENVVKFRSVQDTITDIRKIVEAHPEAVGFSGNLRRAFGGVAQQVYASARSAVRSDMRMTDTAKARLTKLFGTKPEDELEALSIGLIYKFARLLSGQGVMSDMDIRNAERMVSPLRSWIGSDQFLNHLNVLEREATRIAKESEEMLRAGSVLKDAPPGRTKRQASELSDEELIRELYEELQGGTR